MLNTSDYSQNILYFLNTRKYPQMPADIDEYPQYPHIRTIPAHSQYPQWKVIVILNYGMNIPNIIKK